MSKDQLLAAIRESLEEDRKNPEAAFDRMVREGLIDAEGRPLQRERRLIFTKRDLDDD